MKILLNCLFGLFAAISFSSCANGKKLQEKAPVAFQEAHYTYVASEEPTRSAGLKFVLPTSGFDTAEVVLDSVYFKGRAAELFTSDHHPELYVAYFEGFSKNTEVVMDIDPKKEYGNKLPMYLDKIPFDLKAGEAVIRFRKNGKVGYYKLEGVLEKPAGVTE